LNPDPIPFFSQVKLIVVDSITFHFRQDFKDMGHRTRVLTQMAQDFMAVAEKYQLAVVFINQVRGWQR
jgi:RAD51-like protein 2